jgi:hypothetical protein
VEAGAGNSIAAKVGVHGAGLAVLSGTLNSGGVATTLSLHEPITGALIPGTRMRVTGSEFGWTNLPSGRFLVQAATDGQERVQDPSKIHQQSYAVARSSTSCTPKELKTQGNTLDTVDFKEISTSLTLVGAIAIKSPVGGAVVEAPPEFEWKIFPNTDFYVVEVRDSTGHTVFGGFALDETPRMKVPADALSLQYGDLTWANVDPSYIPSEPLISGSVYAWRIFACKDDTSAPQGMAVVSSSVLARGRFVFALPPKE